MVQEGAAVLLLLDLDGWPLAGDSGGCDGAALAQLVPSSCGEGGAPSLAVETQMCADLRRPEAPHLALRSRLVQLHRGFPVPGGNRRLLQSLRVTVFVNRAQESVLFIVLVLWFYSIYVLFI